MPSPKVTIGIPAYNAARYLETAVNSVLKQSFDDFELIIINDGSKDDTSGILKKFHDNRLRIVDDRQNKGLISRLNQMVEMAGGQYFARMDADDIMFPERIEKQVAYLDQNPQIKICSSSAVSINKDSAVLGLKKVRPAKTPADILSGKSPIHPTVAGRTSFFRKNPYRSGFFQMEDMELWYRTIDDNFGVIDEPLLFYREDSIPNSGKHKKMYKGLEKFAGEYLTREEGEKILSGSRKKYYLYKILEALSLEKIALKRRYIQTEDLHEYEKILTTVLK